MNDEHVYPNAIAPFWGWALSKVTVAYIIDVVAVVCVCVCVKGGGEVRL